MDTQSFKKHLLNSALDLVAARGWNQMSIIDAAKNADLSPARAREHFPFKSTLLLYLNTIADEKALVTDIDGEHPKDALFDLFMARFDLFQKHRAAIMSILYVLPRDPALTLLLGAANAETMRWLGHVAGIDISSPIWGFIHINQLVAIWTQAVRHWAKDDTHDMTTTMAELDKLLSKKHPFGLYPRALETQTQHGEDPFSATAKKL